MFLDSLARIIVVGSGGGELWKGPDVNNSPNSWAKLAYTVCLT